MGGSEPTVMAETASATYGTCDAIAGGHRQRPASLRWCFHLVLLNRERSGQLVQLLSGFL